ncbi:hypothetical protein [Amycolatopsis cihanbeyliensis]|uniref:Beta-lactamase n=1 Tax=Amycolatopsis cihanbeyliensis TaxID=1128664 RepID=A0A542DS26_AMYCI|nr:hypothetical protein [Amycolatopsis cihanbeyliensis]TQJ05931.1 hypothetical protein FB471_5777 [Amycolatopsis cihanbeyliensis]
MPPSARHLVISVVAAAVLATSAAVALSGSAAAGQLGDDPYPGVEWERVDPAAAGFDPAKLAQIAEKLKAGNTNCLVVIRHGRLVLERHRPRVRPGSLVSDQVGVQHPGPPR